MSKTATKVQALTAGRPRDMEKRAAMLHVAEQNFMKLGFAETTIEAIAEGASVSKVTLYNHFTDKIGIFEAVIQEIAARIHAEIASHNTVKSDIETVLNRFGCALMKHVMSAHMMEFEQRLSADMKAMPDVAQRFFAAGPGHVRARLAVVIEEAAQRGELDADQPLHAANDLLGLWHGSTPMEVNFGVAKPPTPAQIKQKIKHGVEVFLRAYAKPSKKV